MSEKQRIIALSIRGTEKDKNRLLSLPRGKNHWRYGNNPTVLSIHKWLKNNYGKPDRCESIDCNHISKKFDLALIKGKEYERKRENFIILCRSCHKKYDMSQAFKDKTSIIMKERWIEWRLKNK